MKRETIFWTVLFLIGAVFLGFRAVSGDGMGKSYVRNVEKRFVDVGDDANPEWVDYDSTIVLDHPVATQSFDAIPDDRKISWVQANTARPVDFYRQGDAGGPFAFSLWRTIGIWVGAFFTLAIFSFLYKDNPLYKVAESVVVGVSAAYWMVVGFWDVIVPNLIAKLAPSVVQNWAMPGLDGHVDLVYLVPLILGIMLLWRLSPKGAWISRWPLAFIIGTTAGIRLIGFIHADFLSQIRNSIVPVIAMDAGGFDLWESVRNVILVIGVLTCLVYFFFSFEHKGVVGHTARVGIWFLMITFGAAFGYTVMGRIALLAIRLEFLFDEWLWLIDPTGKRAIDGLSMLFF